MPVLSKTVDFSVYLIWYFTIYMIWSIKHLLSSINFDALKDFEDAITSQALPWQSQIDTHP